MRIGPKARGTFDLLFPNKLPDLPAQRDVCLGVWFRECDRHTDRLALRRDAVPEFTKVGHLENRQRLRINRDHFYLWSDANYPNPLESDRECVPSPSSFILRSPRERPILR